MSTDWGEILAGALASGLSGWAEGAANEAKAEREAERAKGLKEVEMKWEEEKLGIQLANSKELNKQQIDAQKETDAAKTKREEAKTAKEDARNVASDAREEAKLALDTKRINAMISNSGSSGGSSGKTSSLQNTVDELVAIGVPEDEAKSLVVSRFAGTSKAGAKTTDAQSFIQGALGTGSGSRSTGTGSGSGSGSGSGGGYTPIGSDSIFATTGFGGEPASTGSGSSPASTDIGEVIGGAVKIVGEGINAAKQAPELADKYINSPLMQMATGVLGLNNAAGETIWDGGEAIAGWAKDSMKDAYTSPAKRSNIVNQR